MCAEQVGSEGDTSGERKNEFWQGTRGWGNERRTVALIFKYIHRSYAQNPATHTINSHSQHFPTYLHSISLPPPPSNPPSNADIAELCFMILDPNPCIWLELMVLPPLPIAKRVCLLEDLLRRSSKSFSSLPPLPPLCMMSMSVSSLHPSQSTICLGAPLRLAKRVVKMV